MKQNSEDRDIQKDGMDVAFILVLVLLVVLTMIHFVYKMLASG